jgi:alanyl-tRNA synthetase
VQYLNKRDKIVRDAELFLKTKDITTEIDKLKNHNITLEKELKVFQKKSLSILANELFNDTKMVGGVNFISKELDIEAKSMKEISGFLRKKSRLVVVLAAQTDDKALISIVISDDLVSEGYDASKFINKIAKEISGSGGGQSYYATAGGSNIKGISKALSKSKALFSK